MAHSNVSSELSAGVKGLPGEARAFADTQALWRFLANERVTPEELAKPVMALAREQIAQQCDAYALVMHDWSRLNFGGHASKRDRLTMTHASDIGYELQSSLLVSDREGAPLAVPVQNLVTADGVLTTRQTGLMARQPHLDELSERIVWLEQQNVGRPLVHIVDREADSVAHLRDWSASGSRWLIRVKEGSRVRAQGRDMRVSEVSQSLTYHRIREVQCAGQRATQWVAETTVVLARAAKSARIDDSGKRVAPQVGEPLAVKLIVSRIIGKDGAIVAQWYLLSNLEQSVAGETLALWYYYRWRIESYFKLLKQAGHQVERWEQETGKALFKRLLIVAQACALAWRVMSAQGLYAEQVKAFLVRLSGRQMKRKRPITAPALLDGMFKLFMMLDTLQHYSLDELKRFAHFALFHEYAELV